MRAEICMLSARGLGRSSSLWKHQCRDPIFLREKLQGSTIVGLKKILAKHAKKRSSVEEVGSFQLRKRRSGKPQGFVDAPFRFSSSRMGALLLPQEVMRKVSNSQQYKTMECSEWLQDMEIPTPPSPLPPSHVGYLPTSAPPHTHTHNVGVGPAFGMGVGAGALAAGAVIFCDDFVSGFNLPPILQDASLTISTNSLF
ncbi:hypothetical protein Sjap_016220 [Stephania japonica]|uniref:Uncharacterized protein n=1 Tax=Stephania japonica TaxID=461633 RepID=A0AAP0ILT4_9MAGN